jgi:hypothetical protein
MKSAKYAVTARVLELGHGVIGLSDAQAKLRQHALKKVGKGRFEILAPVQFKAGEVLEFDGDLPKSLVTKLEPELTEKEKKAAEAKAKAEREAAEAEAKVTWEGSDELKAQFPEFEQYLASLGADGNAGEGGSEETK